jgi:hypothetical protein
MSKDAVLECYWECRKTKIELEHEVLLREMEAIFVAMAGLPVTFATLILQFDLWKNGLLLLSIIATLIIIIVYLDDYRSDRKSRIEAKERELDALVIEMFDLAEKKS